MMRFGATTDEDCDGWGGGARSRLGNGEGIFKGMICMPENAVGLIGGVEPCWGRIVGRHEKRVGVDTEIVLRRPSVRSADICLDEVPPRQSDDLRSNVVVEDSDA